jgi:hypothetical protein
MSHANRTTNNVEPFFHQISHCGSPDDVLGDAKLSTEEKRLILSSCRPFARSRVSRTDSVWTTFWQRSSAWTMTSIRRHAGDWPCGCFVLASLTALLPTSGSASSTGTHRRGAIGR